MGITDEIKQRIDIIEIVSQYTALTKAGKTFKGLCPFHSEKHGSFFVYPQQQSWHCFGACGTGGDVFSFVMKKEGLSFSEALHSLAERAGVIIPARPEQERAQEEKEELYKINESAAQYYHNLLLNSPAAEKARNYIAKRGLQPKTASDFQLGYSLDSWEALKQYLLGKGYTENKLLTAGLLTQTDDGRIHDHFRGRLMFPIHDVRGRTIGFGARVLDESLPKYLNSSQTPLFDKSECLYGIDRAAASIKQQDMVVIVEGYMDVITAHQNGVTNVVASMGTAISEKHANRLKKLAKNVVLSLDADAAGEEAMLRGVGLENALDAEVKVVILPEGKDPDEVIKENISLWRQLVKEALPIVDYTFNLVASKLDLTTARGKSLVVERLMPIVAEIGNPVRRAHYVQKLARLVRMSERYLEPILRKVNSDMTKRRTRESKPEAITYALRTVASDPVEEYLLAILFQHPELKNQHEYPTPEYFESSENREILIKWQQADSLPSLKENLDTALHEHVDYLINKKLPPANVERKYSECLGRLCERYLKNMEARRAEVLAMEVETGGSGADLARLEKEGIKPSHQQLKEIQKSRGMKLKQQG